MKELQVTPTEELDLLKRWLGPDSKRQAASIRVANSHDESLAVERIWQRLDERYGSPEQVLESINNRLYKFPKISVGQKDKLYELADLLSEIGSLREHRKYKLTLSYFDSSCGVNSIITKLPQFIQHKWIDQASQYKLTHNVLYPPFSYFVDFANRMATRQNDPSFKFQQSEIGLKTTQKSHQVSVRKTTLDSETTSKSENVIYCVIHENAKQQHTLGDCRTFNAKSIPEKRDLVKKNGLCFKCLNGKHLAKDCKKLITCEKCNSSRHCTAFHIDSTRTEALSDYGGENNISSKCTEICGNTQFSGKSCA